MECMRNQLYEGVVLHGRYETISPLNHGSFGMVFQAKDLVTDQLVAIKVIPTTAAPSPAHALSIDERSEELDIHGRISQHPNIVNLVDHIETANHTYLVLEFCANGDVYEAIRLAKGPRETEHVRDFMLQLVSAVEYMHANGVYHRDIKPENIFLAQDGSMKLGDFGLATTDSWSYEVAVGSDRYMAPEQYDPSHAGYATDKADIWALGICLLNVLFSRNPFAVPATSDPLYADFALDRQSLFDVFPNLSQDAFEVLTHCLAVDPDKRQLSLVKEALRRAITFTTDEESLDDDFCTEEPQTVMASANREPLRTPSISTPYLDNNGGSFPWAKALAMSPPQPIRQLSAIPDTEMYAEDLFPGSARADHAWYKTKPDNASSVSFVDSGLGLSFQSTHTKAYEHVNIARSKPVPIAGSLPAYAVSFDSAFGKKRDAFSKSWSDLWDEEEEEALAMADVENRPAPLSAPSVERPAVPSEAGSGISTPRPALSEMKNPATTLNSRTRSPKQSRKAESHVSQQTGFIFEDHHARHSPPSKPSIADKWAALGDRRRGSASQTPLKAPSKPAQPTPGSLRKRNRTGSWRRPIHWGPSSENIGVSEKPKDSWTLSKDWRSHRQPSPQHDDLGDLEWVGGWNDLHL